MADDLQEKFEHKLRLSKLLVPGQRVFIACSGGPDSTALVHLLAGLRQSWKLRIGIVHFHHGLRGRSADADMRFTEKLARSLQVPFVGGRGDVRKLALREHLSLEEAARKARYEFLEAVAGRRRIPCLALAHTLDDQAETVLMRMIQGTGLQGLRGIRTVRKLGTANLVRPLLGFSKDEILEYLRSRGLEFRRDETNEEESFLRNRIRRRILPLLEREFNPRVKAALARIPEAVTDEAEAVDAFLPGALKQTVISSGRTQTVLSRPFFVELPRALQYRVLRTVLEKLDPRSGLPFETWEAVRGCFLERRFRHSLKRDIDIDSNNDVIRIYKKKTRR